MDLPPTMFSLRPQAQLGELKSRDTTRNDYGGMKCRNIHAELPGAAAAMLEHADKLDEKAMAHCAKATLAELRRIEDERQAKFEKRRSAYRARKAARTAAVVST